MRNTLLTFSAAALFMAGAALAQGPGPFRGGGGRGFGAAAGTAGQPDGTQHVQRLAAFLDLTPDQVTQAQTIFTNERQQMQQLQPSLSQARQNLRTAEQANAANLPQLAAAAASLEAQAMAIRSQSRQAFQALLTPQQLQMYQKLQAFLTGGRAGQATSGGA